MSNKLVKNGMGLVLPNDDVPMLELVITRSGVQLKSPLPPSEVCKLLNNISIDLMFNHFQVREISKIETPV
jgi:hypothetical protein